MTRATLRAGLTRLRRGLREYFVRGPREDESADVAMSPRARIAECWDAAIRRLEAARVLREAGLSLDALILFREAGLLLARATIGATDAAPATSLSDQTTAEKLIQVLESERRPVPVWFAIFPRSSSQIRHPSIDSLPGRRPCLPPGPIR